MVLPSSHLVVNTSDVTSDIDYVINVEDNTLSWSLPLYKSIHEGNWEVVRIIIKQHPAALTARLTSLSETPLLVAVKTAQRLSFIKKLLGFMPPEAVALTDYFGNTALHAVAVLGNVGAAKLLVEKFRDLANIWNSDGCLPIHLAAMRGHRDMTLYLFSVTKQDRNSDPFRDAAGATLVRFAVTAGFYDLALYLVEHNPKLAWQNEDITPLELLAQEPSAFPSGMDFNIWQLLFYSFVPTKLIELPETLVGRKKSPARSPFKLQRQFTRHFLRGNHLVSAFFSRAYHGFLVILWKVLETLVTPLKRVRRAKAMHHQALELVKRVVSEIRCLDNAKASSILTGPFLLGAQNGIHEIVREILNSFPHATTFLDEENHSVFHLAVMYRHAKIFKIVHQQSRQYKMALSVLLDNRANNILHLVAYKPHQDLLDLSFGAVLRMQRELQWYKEVEKFVLPQERKSKNADGKTPLTIFKEEHHELVAYETQWMIGMSTSCSVAASLIATVAFAAAITVPGGNTQGNGLPIFSGERAFLVFIISDALALVSSVSSVLSFLSIFTSRYAVNDFLHALPNRLIIGLISLFLSVTSLMIAFSSTMFLVAAEKNGIVLFPIIALACVPVSLFTCFQLPPLLNMIKSTYSPTISN